MVQLKAMMEDLGFEEVQTYIQSGNIFFKSKEKEEGKLQAKIKKGILEIPLISSYRCSSGLLH
jgi:uncharacterized protein (DUF1697 family)